MEEQKQDVKPQCPKCKGYSVMYKKTTNSQWCRRCGHEWEAKHKE